MQRKIVIVLMIWGLIAQPLAAAVLDFMPATNSTLSVMADGDSTLTGHHAMSDVETTNSPCHETADQAQASMDCADCDDGCANGACASSCLFSSPAVMSQVVSMHGCNSHARVIGINDALVQGIPPRIFHPPKRA